MSKAIDVALYTPKEPLTPEQQSYIHGWAMAPWQKQAMDHHWDTYPQHRAHYLKAYKYFKGYNVKHKASSNAKRLAGAAPEPTPEVSTKLRNV
ncbi:hypothetical protein N9N82_03100 [Luminiphilus sp.]|nr:hypothetical protein [Luminiphilus sp.]